MPFTPQSVAWPSDRAILFVHGVGSYKAGDYDNVKVAFESALGADEWKRYAVYEMFWDPISDAVREKLQADGLFDKLLGGLKAIFPSTSLGAAVAEGAGDVLWPVLHADGREALRRAHIRQLQQIEKDGRAKGHARRRMKVVVASHSLGCFHTYETFGEASADDSLAIHPSTGFHVDAWIAVASPVQLIRSAAQVIQGGLPSPNRLHCLRDSHLAAPGYSMRNGRFVPYARRILAIAGNLDPVGGFVFRKKLGSGYMNLPGTDRIVEDQQIASLGQEIDLETLIRTCLQSGKPWAVRPDNPHDWVSYVNHNAEGIRTWLLG